MAELAQNSSTSPVTKPNLTFWQIWNMCFGFLGIQAGFALQNANVSRIFQTLGAEIDDIAILWVAAPLTGLLVQPIIGYMSDHTWNRLGRRRPYFLIGAVLSSLALFIMPNSPVLWVAAGTLWIMDASFNIAMEPFRAFVGDMLPDKQRTRGYAMQSFFIGVGAVGASALPWLLVNFLDVSNTAPPGQIPDAVKYAFYFGGTVLFITMLWTIVTTREYPPELVEKFAALEAQSAQAEGVSRVSPNYLLGGVLWLVGGVLFTLAIITQALAKELYILSLGIAAFGLIQFITAWLVKQNRTNNGFFHIVDDLFHMPKTMKQLAVVQFFAWFALFAMWVYSTPAVTAYHYGTSDPSSAMYNNGANWVGVLFAAYNGFAALAAFVIPWLASRTNRRLTHLICLSLGGLGLISFLFTRDPGLLWLSMIGVGFAWASILSIPYAILSGAVPLRKMGVYMGIFNFFIVIPQLLAASILGLFVKYLFGGEAIYALALGGLCMILAGLLSLWVEDRGE